MKEIAQLLANEKCHRAEGRTVIITQGKDPVIVARTNGTKIDEYPTVQLDKSKIVDTNGAGDSFVGGFLAQLIQNQSFETCIRCGIYAATEVIQVSGVIYPNKCNFTK